MNLNNFENKLNRYKSILEKKIINLSYLYSGDVISSKPISITENINKDSIDIFFIIKSIDIINEKSLDCLISKADNIELNVDSLNIEKIYSLLNKLNIRASYIFCSNSSLKYFDINNHYNSYSYLSHIKKYKDCFIHYSPYIKEDDDRPFFYVSDLPIQSLVYSIQNLNYKINQNIHTIDLTFYECDFLSYKVIVNILN